jgi:S-DNA-T family DNA segregation ATPase FtsK/SpoIIIE
MRWTYPKLALLDRGAASTETPTDHTQEVERTLSQHKAPGRVVGRNIAPQLVRYRIKPGDGVLPSKMERLTDALSVATAATVRYAGIDAGHVVFEVPRETRDVVSLRDTIEASPALIRLGFPAGLDSDGRPLVRRLADLPHLLIAGETGSGKSGFLNALILSLLSRNTPDDMQTVMIDPKRVELSPYEGLPHMAGEVIDDMQDAARAFEDVVQVMEQRYELMKRHGVRDLSPLNDKLGDGQHLPRIVVIVDELADLIMQAPASEDLIVRLGNKGRAAGIHMVLATQKPDAKTMSSKIKANIPARAVFRVSSHTDSKVALDFTGAERLTGKGDGLWRDPSTPRPVRFQAPWVTDEEVARFVDAWHVQAPKVSPPVVQARKVVDDADARARKELEAAKVEALSEWPDDPQEVVDEAGITPEVMDALAELLSQKIAGRIIGLLDEKKEASQ